MAWSCVWWGAATASTAIRRFHPMLSASQVKAAAVAILFSNKFHGVHLHMKPYTHNEHREMEGEKKRERERHTLSYPTDYTKYNHKF